MFFDVDTPFLRNFFWWYSFGMHIQSFEGLRAPEKARVRQPLLILFPFVGEHILPPTFFSFFFLLPRFVAWPLELGLGTRNPRFFAWPLELGLGCLSRIEFVMVYPFARHADGTNCKWVAGTEGVRSQSCSGSTENEGPSDHCQQVTSDKDLLRLMHVALGGLKKQTSLYWALAPLLTVAVI